MTDPLMPAVFIGHGSPMNALETNRFTKAWAAFGRSIPRPGAVLAISAHWYTRGSAVTAMAAPTTIHDFNGFPKQLSTFRYPAPGSPELAAQVIDLLAGAKVTAVPDTRWGLDHGTWSVLARMFPKADVPVVQLSVDAGMSTKDRLRAGAALAPLRTGGVLVLASGNVVHNLREVQWNAPNSAAPWNTEFELAAKELMTRRPADIGDLASHRHYRRAAPSPDHLVPLEYLAGLAVAAGTVAEVLVEGPALGSLSMTSYVVR